MTIRKFVVWVRYEQDKPTMYIVINRHKNVRVRTCDSRAEATTYANLMNYETQEPVEVSK